MRPTVLLFDIDGTLVSTGGAGRRSIERAFLLVHGRADACSHFTFDGMTDRSIVRLGLQAIGVAADEAAIDVLLARYVQCLDEAVQSVPEAQYIVHAGMREAVDAGLAAGMAVGLGTGNVREGARVKLGRVGLFEKFSFGGFGDDHELRPELIRLGAERGTQQLGVTLREARVVVIGDTPKDVAAAQAIGAESVAVATGGFTVEQLRASGATRVFATLADEGGLDAILRPPD
ncbi:MAG: haloacid dehalogenase-like hydrolase [Archangium sp.]|nr:haloacid dehalogenase-like hydrolase [Archangium sp.]